MEIHIVFGRRHDKFPNKGRFPFISVLVQELTTFCYSDSVFRRIASSAEISWGFQFPLMATLAENQV